MSDHSTRRPSGRKAGRPPRPKKPRPDFPLYPHRAGYWAKKVRGRTVYFGRVDSDPKGQRALELWLEQRDDLLAGREPQALKPDALTLESLCNAFMQSKERAKDAGEIQPATYREYWATLKDVLDTFGKTRAVENLKPTDFEKLRDMFARKVGATRLCKLVQIVRTLFKYGMDSGLIVKPVLFGPTFKRPAKSVLRKHRAENGPKMFSHQQVQALLEKASPTLRAMVLLGVNCGLGNTDCGRLETRHLDLERGWLTFARPKSGIPRRAKLWPETVDAIREALEVQPAPRDKANAGRVFITKYGQPWAKEEDKSDPVALMFGRLMKSAGIEKRKGWGFYTLRHTYRTVADGCRDQVAIAVTMGHADPSIAAFYRESIEDERLEAVAEHVHDWLFGAPGEPQAEPAGEATPEGPQAPAEPGEGAEETTFRLRVVG